MISILGCLSLGSRHTAGMLSPSEQSENKAARVEVMDFELVREVAGNKASEGKIFLILKTRWENIHAKQAVEKSRTEGKADRTMGVGGLSGKKSSEDKEYVEMDVAYKIRKFEDHAYVLADGLAFSLHPITEKVSGGAKLRKSFVLAKQGDMEEPGFVFLIPEISKNVAFHFFDYQNGHITIPLQGSVDKARGAGVPPGKILGEANSDQLEFAVHTLGFAGDYAGKVAPEGFQYAVVQVSGKSLSGKDIRNIVELKLDEFIWLSVDGGYLCYGAETSSTKKGVIRFTPEIYMLQEVAFLIPETAENARLGLRVKNQVFHIDLTESKPKGLPKAKLEHMDGDVMEVLVFGVRKEGIHFILDLGIRSSNDRSGLNINARNQFILIAGDEEVKFDQRATMALLHAPPKKFVIPPGGMARFELAYVSEIPPTFLRIRGFKGEGRLDLSKSFELARSPR